MNANHYEGPQITTSNPETSDQWEGVVEPVEQNPTDAPKEKPEPITEALVQNQSDEEQQLVKQRGQTINLAISDHERESEVGTMSFANQEIAVNHLGLNKILLEKIEHRPENDIIGRQHDEEDLDLLLQEAGKLSEEELSARFTPTVAGAFIDRVNRDERIFGGYGSLAHNMSVSSDRLLEALPLDIQEQIISKQRRGRVDFAWMEHACSVGFTVSQTLTTKIAMDAICRIKQGLYDAKQTNFFIDTLSEFRYFDRNDFSDEDRLTIFQILLNSTSAQIKNEHNAMDAERIIAKKKILLATAVLSTSYFRDHLCDIIGADYANDEDGLDMQDMRLINNKFYSDNGTSNVDERQQKQYEALFPQSMRGLANIISSPSSQYAGNWHGVIDPRLYDFALLDRLSKIHKAEATDIVNFLQNNAAMIDAVDINDSITLDKNYPWARMLICGNANILTVIRQTQQRWPLDDDLAKNVGRYLSDCYVSHAWSGREEGRLHDYKGSQYHRIELGDIEELRNFDFFLAKMIRQDLEKKDYRFARRHICEYAFGATPEEIQESLAMLGIGEIEIPIAFDEGTAFSLREEEDFRVLKNHFSKQLRNFSGLTDDEALVTLDAIDLICCPKKYLRDKFALYYINSCHDSDSIKIGEILQNLKDKSVKETSIAYSEFMQRCLKKGTSFIGSIEYRDEQIPLLEMRSSEFLLLIHRLGAYIKKDLDSPSDWNTKGPTRTFYNEGRPVGYISTCAIANHLLNLAGINIEQMSSPEEVFYAFTDFNESTLKYTAEYDLYTENVMDRSGQFRAACRKSLLYKDPHDLIRATQNRGYSSDNTYGHNEVVLDRYSGNSDEHGGRLQPNYLVVFTDDPDSISERVKKHAAYFHVPIMMINPQRYA